MKRKQVAKATALAVGLSALMVLTTACSEKTEEQATTPEKVEQKAGDKVEKDTQESAKVEENTEKVQEPAKSDGKDETEAVFNTKVDVQLREGYSFDAEEPGRFILQNQQYENYFSRVEVLGTNINVEETKEETLMALDLVGGAEDYSDSLKTEQLPAFYQGADFFLVVSNENGNKNVVLKKVDGMYLKFNIFYVNEEASEGITPQMLDILATLKVTP